MRITLLLLSAGLTAALGAQQRNFRSVKVGSCPSADSVIGKVKDDWDGQVYGYYDPQGDSTSLWSGTMMIYDEQETWVSAGWRFMGKAPRDFPSPVLGVMVRGKKWHQVLDAASPPSISLVLDDSILIAFPPPLRGTYQGPERAEREIIPLSVTLTALQYQGLARAKKVVVRVGTTELLLGRQDRHDLRALYRVASCPLPVVFNSGPN
jgi:hypothetical protein